MVNINQSDIESLLTTVIDQHLETDLFSAGLVKKIIITANNVTIKLILGYPAKGYLDDLSKQITKTLSTLIGIGSITVDISIDICAYSVQKSLKPLPNIKNIIAVASGKGGVGKSTTSVNLALALVAEGANVGILDADIYGPSIPTMLGLSGYPASDDNKTMNPKVAFGLQTISIAYLIEAEQAMIWRGPMVTNALQQLLNTTRWHNLDYLIIDLPPGTGDIQLTLSQKIPVSGAIIVTTPQDIALIDAQRSLAMFEKVNIPVLGIVENMSLHICSECGYEEAIFGAGGGATMSEKNQVNMLGSLPLDITIRQFADSGKPTVVSEPDSRPAMIYCEIARKMAAKLSLRSKDHTSKFAKIIIQ